MAPDFHLNRLTFWYSYGPHEGDRGLGVHKIFEIAFILLTVDRRANEVY